MFALFGANFLVKNGGAKIMRGFLEGVVLEVTFRLGPELGIVFINLKWNVSAL
jgi:hypothetical protein